MDPDSGPVAVSGPPEVSRSKPQQLHNASHTATPPDSTSRQAQHQHPVPNSSNGSTSYKLGIPRCQLSEYLPHPHQLPASSATVEPNSTKQHHSSSAKGVPCSSTSHQASQHARRPFEDGASTSTNSGSSPQLVLQAHASQPCNSRPPLSASTSPNTSTASTVLNGIDPAAAAGPGGDAEDAAAGAQPTTSSSSSRGSSSDGIRHSQLKVDAPAFIPGQVIVQQQQQQQPQQLQVDAPAFVPGQVKAQQQQLNVDAPSFVPGWVKMQQQQHNNKQDTPASTTTNSSSSGSSSTGSGNAVAAAIKRQLSIAAPAFNPSQQYCSAPGMVGAVAPIPAEAPAAGTGAAIPAMEGHTQFPLGSAVLRHAASEPNPSTTCTRAAAHTQPAALHTSRSLTIKVPSSRGSSSRGSSSRSSSTHAASDPVPAAHKPSASAAAAAARCRPVQLKPSPMPIVPLQVAQQQRQQAAAAAAAPVARNPALQRLRPPPGMTVGPPAVPSPQPAPTVLAVPAPTSKQSAAGKAAAALGSARKVLQIRDPSTGTSVSICPTASALTAAAGGSAQPSASRSKLSSSSNSRLHHAASKPTSTTAIGAATARTPLAIADRSIKALALPAAAAVVAAGAAAAVPGQRCIAIKEPSTGKVVQVHPGPRIMHIPAAVDAPSLAAVPAAAAATVAEVAAASSQRRLQIREPSSGKVVEVQPVARPPAAPLPPPAAADADMAAAAAAALCAARKMLDIIEPGSGRVVFIPAPSPTAPAPADAAHPAVQLQRPVCWPVEIKPPSGKARQHTRHTPAAAAANDETPAAVGAAEDTTRAAAAAGDAPQPAVLPTAEAADEPVADAAASAMVAPVVAAAAAAVLSSNLVQQQVEVQTGTAPLALPDSSEETSLDVLDPVPVAAPVAVPIAVPIAEPLAEEPATLLGAGHKAEQLVLSPAAEAADIAAPAVQLDAPGMDVVAAEQTPSADDSSSSSGRFDSPVMMLMATTELQDTPQSSTTDPAAAAAPAAAAPVEEEEEQAAVPIADGTVAAAAEQSTGSAATSAHAKQLAAAGVAAGEMKERQPHVGEPAVLDEPAEQAVLDEPAEQAAAAGAADDALEQLSAEASAADSRDCWQQPFAKAASAAVDATEGNPSALPPAVASAVQLGVDLAGNPSTVTASVQQGEQPGQPADQQQQQQHRRMFAPNELTAETAAAFETALPAGLLPLDWQKCSAWHELEARICFAVGGEGAAAAVSENIRQYKQAMKQAQAATAAAAAAAAAAAPAAAASPGGSAPVVHHSPGKRSLAGPCHLVPEAAAAFAEALPAGMLPSNWQQFSSWGQLELHVSFTVAGPGAVLQTRRSFKEAQQLAQETTEAAAAAAIAPEEPDAVLEDTTAEEQQQQQQHQQQAKQAALLQEYQQHRDQQQQEQLQQETASEADATAAAAPEASGSASGLAPGSSAWNAGLKRLLSRQDCSGKEAQVKWRVITPDGDRLGPFGSADMQTWLLKGKGPEGVSKQQASKAAADPASLQLCGILSADYSAQRLPSAKFYTPIGQLVPAVAAGLRCAAVAKADIAKGVPAKDWNASPAVAATAEAPAAVISSSSSSGDGSSASAKHTSSKAAKRPNKKQQQGTHKDVIRADQQSTKHASSSSGEDGSSRRARACSNDAAAADTVRVPPASGIGAWDAALIADGQSQQQGHCPAAGQPAAPAVDGNSSSSRLQGAALEVRPHAPSPVDDWEALDSEEVSTDPWGAQQQQQRWPLSIGAADWVPEAAVGDRPQGDESDDEDDDVPEGFALRINTISSSSRPEGSSSGTLTCAASTRAAAAHAASAVDMSAAAAAASAVFSTVRLVNAALLSEEQQRQRFVRVLDLMQPAFEPLLVTLDEQQLQVLARIEEADLAALLQQPQAERRLLAFVNQVVRREQQLRSGGAACGEAAAAVLALDKGGARRCIRPQQILPEHAEALAAQFPGFFPPGWLSFAAINSRFASWEAFKAAITFPEPQAASRQYYMRRRELYQACTALLLADRAATASDGVLSAKDGPSEVQQIVQAALQAPPPAPPAAAAAAAAAAAPAGSHPQLLVVQHTGSPAGTPTAAAAAAAAVEESGYSALHAAGGGAGFYVPVAVPVAEPEPVGPKVVFYGKLVCHQCGECDHAAHSCNTSFCQRCDVYGHAVHDCANACERCSRVHNRADGICRTFQCSSCGLFGHKAGNCPSQQCSACGMLGHNDRHCQAHRHCAMCGDNGHLPADCPLVCSRCHMPGHGLADCIMQHCSACRQLGHAADACLHSSSSDPAPVPVPAPGASTAAADIAVVQLNSSSRQHDYVLGHGQLRNTVVPTGDLGYANAAPADDDVLPSHLQHHQRQQQDQGQQQQQPSQGRQPLQLQMTQRYLQAEADSSAVPPCKLPHTAAQQLAASLPAGLLPANWWTYATWQQLDRALSFANHGLPPLELKRRYKEAKAGVQKVCAAAQEAAGEQQKQQTGLARAVSLGGGSAWGDTGSMMEARDSKAVAGASRPAWAAPAPAPLAPMAQVPAAAAAAAGVQPAPVSGSGPEPGSAAWDAALQKLLSRQGCSTKVADVKWRVIMPDGDRAGPFRSADMKAWLLHGRPPKGVLKQQVNAVADDPASLQLCSILSADYSAQRLPGAKFYKPLGQLLPAVAAGLRYAAVAKADIAKGVPAKDWNASPAAAPVAAAPAAAAAVPEAAAAPPPAVSGSSQAWRKQQHSPQQAQPQLQPPKQQRHRLSKASSGAAAASTSLSFAAAAAGDVLQQPDEQLLVDPGTMQPADLSSQQAIQLSSALGVLLPPSWQAMRSWAEVTDNLRRGADYFVQLQTFNSLRRRLQLAAARERSVELAAAEEAQLAAAIALSEQEAVTERLAEQWVAPAWLQQGQQQEEPAGYAAAVARGPVAATEAATPAAAAAAAVPSADSPASPWEGVSSQQARPGSSPWSSALPVEAVVEDTSADAGAAMIGRFETTGGLDAAATAAPADLAAVPGWKRRRQLLPATSCGISGVPATALPYVGQQQQREGFDAAAAGHHVPLAPAAADAPVAALAQHQHQLRQHQLSMPSVAGVAPPAAYMLSPGFARAHGLPVVTPGLPPVYGGPAPAGVAPAEFRIPPGFSHNAVHQLPPGYAGAAFDQEPWPGMPPGFGASAVVLPPPSYQGGFGAAVGLPGWGAGAVASQPGGGGPAAAVTTGSSPDSDDDLEEMLGLLGV